MPAESFVLLVTVIAFAVLMLLYVNAQAFANGKLSAIGTPSSLLITAVAGALGWHLAAGHGLASVLVAILVQEALMVLLNKQQSQSQG